MMTMIRVERIFRLALLYAGAAVMGLAFKSLGIPLPWMIGPLILSAILFVSGIAQASVPVQTRPFGQMTVAAQVGLAFSPEALTDLIELAPLLLGSAVASAFCALGLGVALSKMTGVRLPQAILSVFPTSPVEAAVMAERYGCDPAPVILSQTVRIASIVVLVPISIYLIDGWPDRSGTLRVVVFDPLGHLMLALIAVAAALSFRKLRISNPYFLGPLTAVAALTASGMPLPAFPPEVLAAAQIVLGTWLGSTFRRSLFERGRELVIAAFGSSIALLIAVSAIAVSLSWVSGQDWEVLVLGAAPGGVTEMALTAKFLGIDVALVTAFQLTRILIFMPNIPWIIRLISKWEARQGG